MMANATGRRAAAKQIKFSTKIHQLAIPAMTATSGYFGVPRKQLGLDRAKSGALT